MAQRLKGASQASGGTMVQVFKGVGCLESFHIPLSSAFIWNPADLWFATVLEVGKGPQEEKSGQG